eukprot:1157218-Pelagomonas_calceolata.AAC.16
MVWMGEPPMSRAQRVYMVDLCSNLHVSDGADGGTASRHRTRSVLGDLCSSLHVVNGVDWGAACEQSARSVHS